MELKNLVGTGLLVVVCATLAGSLGLVALVISNAHEEKKWAGFDADLARKAEAARQGMAEQEARAKPIPPASIIEPPPKFQLAKPLSTPAPAYPMEAQVAGHEGVVLCRIHIASTGGVERVDVVRPSGFEELDVAAMAAMSQWKYSPMTEDGKAVPTSVMRKFEFERGGVESSAPKPLAAPAALKVREPVSTHYEDSATAWAAAQILIEEHRLKSPSSAEWPTDGWLPAHSYSDFVSHQGNGRYVIRAWVDADNSFGAKIRTRFIAGIVHHGGYDWRMSYFDVID
jgi:TonB family protein